MEFFTKHFAKIFIIAGIFFIIIGLLANFSDKLGWLGRLPGDIYIKKNNFSFSFPIVTCILISIILTVLMYIFSKH